MLYFSAVDIAGINILSAGLLSTVWRNNQNYRMLISICQLLAEGLLLTTEQGEYRLAAFLDEQRMCRLYEKFILEYYRKDIFQPAVRNCVPDSLGSWTMEAVPMLPVMQSDITAAAWQKRILSLTQSIMSIAHRCSYDRAYTSFWQSLSDFYLCEKQRLRFWRNTPQGFRPSSLRQNRRPNPS